MLKENIPEIISRFKNGERDAFAEIIKAYQQALLNFVYRFTGDRARAEDYAQEIFLKAYQELINYHEEGKFTSWLYRLATNFCLNELKKYKRRCEVSLDENREDETLSLADTIIDCSQPAADQVIENQELIQTVQYAILSLPEKQRIALILSQYDKLSYHEIAAILKTSVSSVESLIFRAKQALKKKLIDYQSGRET